MKSKINEYLKKQKIMRKKIIISILSIFALLFMVNCQDDNFSFGDITTPSNLKVTAEIIGATSDAPNGDGSGKVKFTSIADNAISYKYSFSDGTSTSAPNGVFLKTFTKSGLNTFTIVVIASGKGGVSTNTTIEVTVLSNFKDDEAVAFLTGGAEKKWYFATTEQGHLGVGPNRPWSDPDFGTQNYYPQFYAAGPNEKADTCLYNSILTFSQVGGQIKFNLDNQGQTFFNRAFFDVVGGTGDQDKCFEYDTSGLKNVSLSPSESYVSMNPDNATQTRGTVMNFSDGGFMGYYVGASSYEILSITNSRMVVRCIDAKNDFLAWYFTFTTTPPGGGGGTEPDDYTVLSWSDEFNVNGAVDPTKWTYDIGNGDGGWGNQEKQYYTNRSSNIKVEGGNLIITAKKELFSGFDYTSARIKTQGIYDFKYGKVEMRAKLATGGGTWPAIWSLGKNVTSVTWPACGEIDFLEHVGNEQNKIFGSLHYPGFSGGNAVTGSKVISNASTEFHTYKVIWNDKNIRFFVDDVIYQTATNSSSLPFNANFFMIMNVAMGGNFGGAIDPAFTESSMEVDYIRVYGK